MIHPQYLTLQKVCSGRLFRIPEYQRAYSWRSREREHLFGDIRAVIDEGTAEHFMATIVVLKRGPDVEIDAEAFERVEVVDGQQRLTTLVLLLRALARGLQGLPGAHRTFERLEQMLVKADDHSLVLLQTNHDTGEAFANYLRHGALPNERRATTAAERNIHEAIHDVERFVAETPADERMELASVVLNRLTFVVHELSSEKAVYTVFEVLNSRGLPVAWFDRLKAMVMAVAFQDRSGNAEEAIAELHAIWSQMYRDVGVRRDVGREAMRFAATLVTAQHQNRLLGEEAAATVLRDACRGRAAGAIEVSRRLLDVVRALHELATDTSIGGVTQIVQARFLALALRLRALESGADRRSSELLFSQWERTTFRIFGLARRDSRTRVGAFVRLGRAAFVAWREGGAPSATDREIVERLARLGGGEFGIDRVVTQLRDSNCYEGWQESVRYFFREYERHLAREANRLEDNEHWADIVREPVARSIEHICPQSKGSDEPTPTGIFVHRLGNLVLLPPRLNSRLQAKPFSRKRDSYVDTGLLIAKDVVQQVPARGRWTRQRVVEREKALLAWASVRWADVEVPERDGHGRV